MLRPRWKLGIARRAAGPLATWRAPFAIRFNYAAEIIPQGVSVFNSSSPGDMINSAADNVDDAVELILRYDDRRCQANYVTANSRK